MDHHPSPPPSIPTTAHYYITNLGLGYAIAIAFGFLVLFSSLLLTSYICFCHRHIHHPRFPNSNVRTSVIVPSIIFVDNNNNNNNNTNNEDENNCVVGLDQSVINTYPMFTYNSNEIMKGVDGVCVICLCEYKELEMMRVMPDCKHSFHLTCVDAWLKLNATCPVCRSSPLSTPLADLIIS